MKSDFQIVQQFKKHKSSTMRGLAKQYDNTRECQAFYAGDMQSYRDNIQFMDTAGVRRRAMVQFNKVKPYVNAVKGFAAQNRRKAKYSARTSSPLQQMYSTYCNSIADYTRDKTNADQTETQQDGDMFINGYGAIETALTYTAGRSTTDPNGQIIMGRLDPLRVGWDPYAVAPNLMDARWVFYEQDYALDQAVDLFDASEDDFETAASDEGMGDDSDYRWYQQGGRLNKIKESNIDWSDQRTDMARIYFYQWYEFETFYRAENPIYTLTNPQSVMLAQLQLEAIAQEFNTPENEDMFQFDPRAEILNFNDDIRKRLLAHFEGFIEPVSFKRKVFYTAVISGDHVFTKYRSQSQQGYSIKFKTGDYDARNKVWIGMVNSMKDPVLYFNKALTEIMFIIGANSKGGVMYERGTIEDIQSFEDKYARTDSVVEVNEGALAEGRIKPKREPFAPSGYEEVVQISNDSISDVTGIDKSFLGSSENKEETGILQKRRIRQVVSGLACYFDSITLYQKDNAELLLDYMKIWAENNDGGLVRIIGQDGKDNFLKISSDKFTDSYDISIQEAPQTPEEKQEYATVLTSIGDKLAAVGDLQTAKVVYAMAVKYTPMDQADIMQLTQVLMPKDPKIDPAYVQQLEQQIQALSNEVSQAQVRDLISKALLNMAKVEETKAKLPGYHAETIRTEQEALQKGLENHLLAKHGTKELNVNV